MSKKNEMSLVSLLQKNPDFDIWDRIEKGAEEVKKDVGKIKTISDAYNEKYKDEIKDGTMKRQLLISEGAKRGLSAEESLRGQSFVPSIYTPILNWLYFFMREDGRSTQDYIKKEQDTKYKSLLHEQQEIEQMDKLPEAFVFLSGKVTNEQFQKLKKLKKLALRNDNPNESNQAYRKCLELCEFFDIDFNKIPI